MGGPGSGGSYQLTAKRLTSESLPIDIRVLKRENRLRPGNTILFKYSRGGVVYARLIGHVFATHLTLQYCYGKSEEISQKIWFDWTPCNFGNQRIWFKCPFCQKRVAIIYGPDKLFACRKCNNLTYQSCNETAPYRILYRIIKLESKLQNREYRPKGMHNATYHKIKTQLTELIYMYLKNHN